MLRAGWGIFYDRFTNDLVLQAERQNGFTQQEYIVTDPTFYPNIPPISMLQSAQTGVPTIYRIQSNLHAPYTMQTAVTVERQLSKAVNMTVSYVNSRGVHELLTNNINAPLPGTYIVGQPTSGIRPNGILENIYEYESEGVFKQNQLITNINVRAGARLTLNGYYSLNYANSDTSGPTSFPSNPYDIGADYGRASFDIRDRAFFGGTITLPKGFRLNPFMIINSGTPFNVTVPLDLIRDFHFERPACARFCHDMPGRPNGRHKHLCARSWEPSIPYRHRDSRSFQSTTTQGRANLRSICGSRRRSGSGRRRKLPATAAAGGPGGPGGFGRGIGGGPGGGGRGGGGGGALADRSAARQRAASATASRSA